jgi:hypothetical protein
VRNTQINEPGFFSSVNDINRRAQDGLGWLGEVSAIPGLPQCIGANRSDLVWLDRQQKLLEALQAGKTALDGLGCKAMIREIFAQLNFFCQDMQRAYFTVLEARHD